MGIVSVDIGNIAEAQDIKLTLTTSTSRIDWEQDRPRQADTGKADYDKQLEEP